MRGNSSFVVLTLAAVAVVALAASAGAAVMTIGPTAPVVDSADIANLAPATGSEKLWTDTRAIGQTFTTGSQDVVLDAITLQSATGSLLTKTYTLTIGTVSGTSYSAFATESGIVQSVDSVPDDYWTFMLDTPVTLSANTLYGFDLAMNSSTTAWQTGIPYRATTADLYTDGQQFRSEQNAQSTPDIGYIGGDKVFHLNLEPASGGGPGPFAGVDFEGASQSDFDRNPDDLDLADGIGVSSGTGGTMFDGWTLIRKSDNASFTGLLRNDNGANSAGATSPDFPARLEGNSSGSWSIIIPDTVELDLDRIEFDVRAATGGSGRDGMFNTSLDGTNMLWEDLNLPGRNTGWLHVSVDLSGPLYQNLTDRPLSFNWETTTSGAIDLDTIQVFGTAGPAGGGGGPVLGPIAGTDFSDTPEFNAPGGQSNLDNVNIDDLNPSDNITVTNWAFAGGGAFEGWDGNAQAGMANSPVTKLNGSGGHAQPNVGDDPPTFNEASFSIDIPADTIVDLTTVTWDWRAATSSGNQRWLAFRTSLDDTLIFSELGLARNAVDNQIIALDDPKYKNLTDQTVSFYWYASGEGSGDIDIDTIIVNGEVRGATAVPEPSTVVLAALGLLGLGWYGQRRRR